MTASRALLGGTLLPTVGDGLAKSGRGREAAALTPLGLHVPPQRHPREKVAPRFIAALRLVLVVSRNNALIWHSKMCVGEHVCGDNTPVIGAGQTIPNSI